MAEATSTAGKPGADAPLQGELSGPLRGRRALITGGSRGIGAACATALAGLGADLILLGRTAETLTARAEEITGAFGVDVQTVTADATDADSLRATVAGAAEAWGPVTVLVNNTGGTTSAPFGRLSHEIWSETLALNLTSAYVVSQAVLPQMQAAGWGRIVNMASIAGLHGAPYIAAYCAAKHGLIGLTRSLALETAKAGITVNAVCPGYVDTDMTAETIDNIVAKTGRDAAAALDSLVGTNPQGRLVLPEEVANAVAWLCSPGAEAITGQSIVVSGGEVM